MRAQFIGAAIFALVASATPAAKPPALPPYTGAYQPQGVDEKGIWQQFDEQERGLRDSKFVVQDPALKDYVERVLCQAVGDDRCRSVRIYIVRQADFNASMAPNGTMIVNTGMLLRLRDEAELAGVLGHEFAHFELRHGLVGFKRARRTSDLLAWTALLGAPYNTSTLLLGAFFAFNREQERAADLKSAEYLAASPYSVAAMARTWDTLLAEFDATAAERKRRSRRYRGTSFADGHPSPSDRSAYLAKVAAQTSGGGETRDAQYRAAVSPWLPRLIDDQIGLNDFGGSDFILAQRASGPWSNDLLLARAELYRRRGNPRDLVAAQTFYQDILASEPGRAEALRGLGLVKMRNGDMEGGRNALRRYLRIAPGASDASMIEAMTQ